MRAPNWLRQIHGLFIKDPFASGPVGPVRAVLSRFAPSASMRCWPVRALFIHAKLAWHSRPEDNKACPCTGAFFRALCWRPLVYTRKTFPPTIRQGLQRIVHLQQAERAARRFSIEVLGMGRCLTGQLSPVGSVLFISLTSFCSATDT